MIDSMAPGGGAPLAEIDCMADSAKLKILFRARDNSVPDSDTTVMAFAIINLIFVGKELCYRDAIEELNMLNITQKL